VQKTRAAKAQCTVTRRVSKREKRLRKKGEKSTLTLLLLVTAELKVLAALEGHLHLVLAHGALKTEDNLLGGLRLLVENGLGLSSVTCFSGKQRISSAPVGIHFSTVCVGCRREGGEWQ
jgi:hypothetical protein